MHDTSNLVSLRIQDDCFLAAPGLALGVDNHRREVGAMLAIARDGLFTNVNDLLSHMNAVQAQLVDCQIIRLSGP